MGGCGRSCTAGGARGHPGPEPPSLKYLKRPTASETGGTFEVIYKIRFWNKPQALELLGRHQGLFREDAQQPIAQVPAFCLPEGCNGVSVQ
jgi:hypothetical protein